MWIIPESHETVPSWTSKRKLAVELCKFRVVKNDGTPGFANKRKSHEGLCWKSCQNLHGYINWNLDRIRMMKSCIDFFRLILPPPALPPLATKDDEIDTDNDSIVLDILEMEDIMSLSGNHKKAAKERRRLLKPTLKSQFKKGSSLTLIVP